MHSVSLFRSVRVQGKSDLKQNVEDYENNMKGKLKSFLSCIPDVVSYDIDPTKDDFVLLSTDGIFQSMSINEVVLPLIYSD